MYFANILVQILRNNKKLDIFRIYTKWAVVKCPIWNFYAPRKPRNSKNQKCIQYCGTPCKRNTHAEDTPEKVFEIVNYKTKCVVKGVSGSANVVKALSRVEGYLQTC